MKAKITLIAFWLVMFAALLGSFSVTGDSLDTKKGPLPVKDTINLSCLRCHAETEFHAEGKTISVPDSVFIHPEKFKHSVHGGFKCIDCHVEEYNTYPHDATLKEEYMNACMDCHGGDENFAQFHFEGIEQEYIKSVHHTALGDSFSCWKCHNPHEYNNMFRHNMNIREVVSNNNEMCLNCHKNIAQNHDWLPNQELHFASVRCIDCHTRVRDTLVLEHWIVPGNEAVKNCVECHSKNSLLLTTLYRHKIKEKRSQFGFLNSSLLKDTFIMGANRNYWLNRLSIGIFVLVILCIVVHATLLKLYRKK